MRAVLCRDFSGPDHLELGEAPDPVPADDEILIDVHAASVTYMDHLLVSGGYQMRPPTPFVPGTEAAGVVAAVGRQVTRFRPGDRAACLSWIGGLGQRMVAKEWKSVRIPDAVSFEIAATVVWRVDDTARASFDVENYEAYVLTQAESALRHLALSYAYDNLEDPQATSETEVTLRSGTEEVAMALRRELQGLLD
jgi:NADPH:quinone reductase-like Zn-dependent oxidoreductase